MPHVLINGARLWFDVRGAGKPLLLHHGYTASRVNWMPVAERLQDRYQIILMECRGTGDSEHTDDGYSLAQYARDVVGLLDHLDLPKVTYAGHSMGGGIGYLLGLDHAERLEQLILMAPIPADGTGEVDPQLREERRQLRRAGDRAGLLARYQAMRFRPEVETDAWLESRVEHVLGVSDGHYEDGATTMHELQVGDRLADLATPTLMIAGAVDGLLTANLLDFLKLPNASLEVLSRAGHEVAIHEPDAVSKAIASFMEHGAVTASTLMAQLESKSA
ncbi:MAG: alpha/beta hydrolase [Gammaproteobacteria bacterium]|nr:alpha/beta hydrolase [Gammaproteobacteria bacterium]